MKINLPEKYADLYLKALSEKKRALEAKIEDFKKEIMEIDNHMQALTSMSIFQDSQATYNPINIDVASYRSEWPWTRKITHYQEVTNKLFTSSEVVDYILRKEPSLIKSKVRSSISAALSNRHKKGEYIKYIHPATDTTYYGLPEWFINGQRPIPEYVPD